MEQSRESQLEDIFQKFTQDFGLYSVAQVIPSLLGVAALMLFTRVFSNVAYGRYAIAMSFVGILSTITFNWIKQSIIRFEPEVDDTELVGNVLSMLVGGGLLVVFGTGVGYLLIGGFLGAYQPFYFAGAALVVSQGTFKTFQSLFQSRLQSDSLTRYKLFLGVTKLVFAVVLAVFVFDNIVGWMWGHVLALMLTIAFMARKSGVLRFSPRVQSAVFSRFARYGFPMIGWLLGMTLLQFADRTLIGFLSGSGAAGVYAANYNLVQRGLFLVFTPIGQAAQPLMMNTWDGTNNGEIRDLMTDFTRYFFIIGIPAMVFAAAMSRPLSMLLLGFHEGYIVIAIVAPGMFLWNAALLGHTGFEIEERPMILVLGIGTAVVLNIVLNVLLIRMYGYVGAAVATSISFASYTVFAYIASMWSIRWRLPTRTIRNTAIGGIVMAVPAAALYFSGAYTHLRTFGAIGVGGVFYLFVLYALSEFRSDEVATVTGLIQGNYND